MKKEKLLESAKLLKPVEAEIAQEYADKLEQLVAEVNRQMLQRPDIIELVGEKNIEMMKNNHSNHARFVESILHKYNPEVLTDTVLWVFRSYRSRGFHQNYWAAQLNAWVDALTMVLSEKCFDEVYPLYNWFIINIPAFTDVSDIQLTEAKQDHGV